MENHHRKISGDRELSGEEIDLINKVKAAGDELLELQEQIISRLNFQKTVKESRAEGSERRQPTFEEMAEYQRFNAAEPHRWAAIGKTNIQTGVMALVRAIAQPKGV